jgi:hypothetical protein
MSAIAVPSGDAHSTFGSVVGRAGDVNLDGVPDFLVGETSQGLPDFWILSGKDGSVLHHFRVALDDAPVGVRVDGGVDLDGDGVPDLLIATQPFGRNTKGALHLVSGNTARELRKIDVHGIAGPRGEWAHFVSDFDHDGTPDVGALRPRSGTRQSVLTIYSGKTGAVLTDIVIESGCVPNSDDDDCEPRDNGFIETEAVGGFLEADDVDGDGTKDFAVVIDGCRSSPGFVSLYSGATKRLIWKHQSWKCCGSFASICVVGDLDRDGSREIAVGFPDIVDVVSGMSGVMRFEFSSDEVSDSAKEFGWSVASLGDVNADGVPDLAVAESDASVFCGAVHAYSGKDGSRLWSLKGCADEAWHLGYSLASIGDVDGDGVTDLIAGTWEGSSGEPGLARVISGKRGTVIYDIKRPSDAVVVERKSTATKK